MVNNRGFVHLLAPHDVSKRPAGTPNADAGKSKLPRTGRRRKSPAKSAGGDRTRRFHGCILNRALRQPCQNFRKTKRLMLGRRERLALICANASPLGYSLLTLLALDNDHSRAREIQDFAELSHRRIRKRRADRVEQLSDRRARPRHTRIDMGVHDTCRARCACSCRRRSVRPSHSRWALASPTREGRHLRRRNGRQARPTRIRLPRAGNRSR